MAAAMAAASIVFRDDAAYSKRLTQAAETLFRFTRGSSYTYSRDRPFVEPYYNSTGYSDEHMWGASWLFLATENVSYLSVTTNIELARRAQVLDNIPELRVLCWDNKLPAATFLLTSHVRMTCIFLMWP